jgi:pectinesterase
MPYARIVASIATAFAATGACAADKLSITVTHSLAQARPAETISIPWSEVNRVLSGAMLQHIAVKDASGHVLPYQVTNVAPEAKDPQGKGIAYGELIFQHDFAAGEKSATFTVEKTEATTPPFPSKVFARYVPERLDDFAWENDKVGHRTYGPALAAPAPAGSDKEVLVTSGLDIWFKRVAYPVVDRWYNKGHDHYHKDEGEGMDMYNVGRSRGAGGTGIWDGKTLYSGRNYASWKVLANGPVRAIFELQYDAWDAAGVKVSETKRFTVDAGHYFDQIDSTFTFTGTQQLIAAVGLNKDPADRGQAAAVDTATTAADPSLSQWVVQKSNGAFGTAVIMPSAAAQPYAQDGYNQLLLASVNSGQPLRYYVGAAWDRAGEFTSRQAWLAHVAAEAARVRSPVKVTLSAAAQ